MGHNPINYFTGGNVVPERNWNAGGWDRMEPMTTWTLQQTGALNYFRWDPNAQTATQVGLSAVPGINRFVKTSDQGYREAQRAAQKDFEAARDQEFLKLPDVARSLEMEYFHLQRLPPNVRTPQQEDRMSDLKSWYSTTYQPAWEGIRAAVEDGKPAVADQIRKGLAADSKDWLGKR